MVCPLCQKRQARRRCPALGRDICPVCCGTKRLSEIACPADCAYLVTAQAHPAAAVRKRQERDLALVVAMREGLSASQSDLYWSLLGFLAQSQHDPLFRLQDDDVAEACGSMAATFETAERGVIYEHRPNSLVAQRLYGELKAYLSKLAEQAEGSAVRAIERDAPVVLRRIERGTREARRVADEGPTTALGMISRVVRAAGQAKAARLEASGPGEPAAPSLLIKP